MTNKPIVVTLCGSTKFKEEFEQVNLELTKRGYIVISVAAFGHADSLNFSETEKRHLDQIHFRKIDISDLIYVIDVNEYVGDSTKNEIVYALRNDKSVFFYSKVKPDEF